MNTSGLEASHPQSYRSFMHTHLLQSADFDLPRCHLPNGQAQDIQGECAAYEQMIHDAGGIDLQLLGIGSDGHIAFNEPSSSLASRTRIKALTAQTRSDNARFFTSAAEVPRLAITMGVGTILDARHIMLLATGTSKASAVRAFIEGPIRHGPRLGLPVGPARTACSITGPLIGCSARATISGSRRSLELEGPDASSGRSCSVELPVFGWY